MTDGNDQAARRGRRAWLLGAAGGVLLGGAGFAALYLDLVPQPVPTVPGTATAEGTAFVPLDPILVSLPPDAGARHLRLLAQIEAAPEDAARLAAMMPRILDMLNGFLRAVEPADLADPAALPRLRAQMLRRAQLAAGDTPIHGLLITEFILQ